MNDALTDKQNQEFVKSKNRDMTATVASRWYRAPEIILT